MRACYKGCQRANCSIFRAPDKAPKFEFEGVYSVGLGQRSGSRGRLSSFSCVGGPIVRLWYPEPVRTEAQSSLTSQLQLCGKDGAECLSKSAENKS